MVLYSLDTVFLFIQFTAVVIWRLKGKESLLDLKSSKNSYDSVKPICYMISKPVVIKIEFI